MSRWDQQYRSLPIEVRTSINNLTNAIFREKTGFEGKIDPNTQPDLSRQWIDIRNHILANQQQFSRWLNQTAASLVDFASALGIFRAIDITPPWIRVARSEIGTKEIPGATHNPRIMEYIRTCTNIQETENQRRYVEREGEEGVEWCSAFVNWCLQRAGIIGTKNALASSWKGWGERLTSPKCGAIAVFSWKNNGYVNHVAFCDEVNGQFMRLGGNQKGDIVSSVPLEKHLVVHYCWPSNH